ncbi:hypothetical protein C1J03_23950 (plasmid) [Sulfitobacter sp. SK012]|uniref:hypothetical protein n=1 Tax=Sulfitobacter sp. SK012 TaxID=1389005 RepID=UPI000E0C9086|nr:hypothetical protein [Sulfitobacter sp. SK012]AXI49164.1 hypothetical protein C1J03_23950 [Sulfitobacter sp. SK012]
MATDSAATLENEKIDTSGKVGLLALTALVAGSTGSRRVAACDIVDRGGITGRGRLNNALALLEGTIKTQVALNHEGAS